MDFYYPIDDGPRVFLVISLHVHFINIQRMGIRIVTDDVKSFKIATDYVSCVLLKAFRIIFR
jgi:hypothetical protein